MELGLQGKIAAVAGSSRGIGRAIAELLAREGATLSLCARHRDPLEATADRICQETGADVYTTCADLSRATDVQRFIDETVERAGGLDILVTNTGGPPPGTFDDFNDDAWTHAHEHLLLSVVRLVRAATPSLRQRGGGRIINITSISVKEPIEGLILSNAYRAGVTGLAKTLSRELANDRILVNTVCPGRIATDRLRAIDTATADQQGVSLAHVRQAAQRTIPLGRYGQPNEIAALVAFLASNAASYITGTTIPCDGGLASGLL